MDLVFPFGTREGKKERGEQAFDFLSPKTPTILLELDSDNAGQSGFCWATL
jgi:hypothetical protein